MLTAYLKTQSALVRYRSSPARPHLDGFVDWLEASLGATASFLAEGAVRRRTEGDRITPALASNRRAGQVSAGSTFGSPATQITARTGGPGRPGPSSGAGSRGET